MQKTYLKPYKNCFWRWRINWQCKSTRIPLGKMRNDGQIFYLPSTVIIVEKNSKWHDPILNFDGWWRRNFFLNSSLSTKKVLLVSLALLSIYTMTKWGKIIKHFYENLEGSRARKKMQKRFLACKIHKCKKLA